MACGGAKVQAIRSQFDMLSNRVEAYVNVHSVNKPMQVYNFFDPAFRKKIPPEQYRVKSSPIQIVGIHNIEYIDDATRAKVVLVINATVMGRKLNGLKISQHWIWVDSQWYLKKNHDLWGHPITPKSTKIYNF